MSTIEDRLTHALAARADLVQPEDLRPLDPPTATVSWLRHPATYVAAAAACAAAIAAPFVLTGDGGASPEPPPTTQTPSLPPQTDVGGDWPIPFPSDPVDVDGDGVQDQVRIRQEPGKPLVGPGVRVEVDLSSTGDQVFGLTSSEGSFVNVMNAVDLDGDGDRELVLSRDEGVPAAVLALRDGQLAEATRPDDPPLVTGTVPTGAGDRGRPSYLWVAGGGLYSYLSVDDFSGVDPVEDPTYYEVDVTRWSLDDGTMVPTAEGRQCVDKTLEGSDDLPVPCEDDDEDPQLFPEAQETIGVGESFDVSADGEPAVVSLERDAVVLTRADGTEQSVELPEGGAPRLYTDLVRMADDNLVVLVAQRSGELDEMTVATTRNGNFFAARVEDETPFGGGTTDAGILRTWIAPDGTLYTGLQTDPDSNEYELNSWELGGTVSADVAPTLQRLAQGCVVIDDEASPPTAEPCVAD